MSTIGVLALQGAFEAHLRHLKPLATAFEVRYPHQLEQCDALILPGGESTTHTRVGAELDWMPALAQIAPRMPMLGTCAGLILMQRLGLLDIEIVRNGFGPQKYSFSQSILFEGEPLEAIFIRAPRILKANTEVLCTLEGAEPICVRHGHWMGCTFHPELSTSTALHRYFITELVRDPLLL